MKSSTKDRIEGSARRASGLIKEKTAKSTKNPRLSEEGKNDKARGTVQKKLGKLKKAVGS